MDSDQKLLKEARMVAVKVHAGQSYDIFPYEKHLDDVVEILEEAGYDLESRIAGYLHDSLEDGSISYNDIVIAFGLTVAEIVFAVTDELGRNRKERKQKTLPKIRQNSRAVGVKLADRIANVEHGIRMKSSMLKAYVREHDEFYNQLYVAGEHFELWLRLGNAMLQATKVARELKH